MFLGPPSSPPPRAHASPRGTLLLGCDPKLWVTIITPSAQQILETHSTQHTAHSTQHTELVLPLALLQAALLLAHSQA
eukprot:COSAG06_NODE_796_length_12220_cov_4.708522_5_plen_78_part_00